MATATKTRKQPATKELIKAATVNRVMSKDGKTCLGYLVKSNSTDTYYQIIYDPIERCYKCNCPATVRCCHIKAVGEVVKTRHSIKAASNIGNFFQALATYAQEQAEQEAITEVEELLEQVMQEHLDDECMACINHQTSGHNHPVTAEEAEYEEWKRLHGYDQPLTRAEYEMLYNPNNLN